MRNTITRDLAEIKSIKTIYKITLLLKLAQYQLWEVPQSRNLTEMKLVLAHGSWKISIHHSSSGSPRSTFAIITEGSSEYNTTSFPLMIIIAVDLTALPKMTISRMMMETSRMKSSTSGGYGGEDEEEDVTSKTLRTKV